MLGLVPTDLGLLLLYLGELLHIVAVVLQGQLGRLQVESDAEVPSAFGRDLDWLTCKSLPGQRLVFYIVLIFAIDFYNEFFLFAFLLAHDDFDVGIGSAAMFYAEVRLRS